MITRRQILFFLISVIPTALLVLGTIIFIILNT